MYEDIDIDKWIREQAAKHIKFVLRKYYKEEHTGAVLHVVACVTTTQLGTDTLIVERVIQLPKRCRLILDCFGNHGALVTGFAEASRDEWERYLARRGVAVVMAATPVLPLIRQVEFYDV